MCGIFFLSWRKGYCLSPSLARATAQRQRHRGPDARGEAIEEDYCAIFDRLRVVGDKTSRLQPYVDHRFVLLFNGEIWRYQEIAAAQGISLSHGASDTEILLPLIHKHGVATTLQLISATGSVFAMVVYDTREKDIYVARDALGVRELYMIAGNGALGVASEAKALQGVVPLPSVYVKQAGPGVLHQINLDKGYHGKARFVSPLSACLPCILLPPTFQESALAVRAAALRAMARRAHADRPVAFWLSGGIDSVAVLGLYRQVHPEAHVHIFSIGVEGSTDLPYVLEAVEHDSGPHTHTHFTVNYDEVCANIPEAVYALETWDTTTVRAGNMMHILAKRSREWCRLLPPEERPVVVYTGEGLDEAMGAYMYFSKAPSPEAAFAERVRLLEEIHFYDGLRVAKCAASAGWEVRICGLDTHFLETVLQQPTAYFAAAESAEAAAATGMPFDLVGLKKPLWREAMRPFVPHSVCVRVKEAMSDGVSPHCSKDSLHVRVQAFAAAELDRKGVPPLGEAFDEAGAFVGDTGETQRLTPTLRREAERPGEKPAVREGQYYKHLYDRYFPGQRSAIPHLWLPAWCPEAVEAEEPSARALAHYTTSALTTSALTTSALKEQSQ